VRGADASHLLHLAAAAWLMSGETRYRDFLADELLGRLAVDRVTHTLGAFVNPKWCRSYYGDHITFGPHWALVTTLAPSPLRDDVLGQLDAELRGKLMADLGNAKFALMYAAVADHDPASRDAQRDEGLLALEGFGGTREHLDEPRRHYALPREDVLVALPDDVTPTCPTPQERARCEAGFDLLGVVVPGEPITHACTGAPAECDMGDGTCADPMASRGLPPTLRRYADFMWQRNPFALGERGDDGRVQSPGLDLGEAFWLARAYGLTARGAGQVLAWREGDSCAPRSGRREEAAQEPVGGRRGERARQLGAGAGEHDATVLEHDPAIDDGLHPIDVVADDDRGAARDLAVHRLDQGEDARGGHRVEARAGIIVEGDARIGDGRAGEAHALLHAARELARELMIGAREADLREARAHAAIDLLGARRVLLLLERKGDVVGDRHEVEQRVVLEQVAEALARAGEVEPRERRQIPAVEQHAPGVRRDEARQELEQDALAVTAGADDAEDLAGADLERDVVEHDAPLVTLGHALDG